MRIARNVRLSARACPLFINKVYMCWVLPALVRLAGEGLAPFCPAAQSKASYSAVDEKIRNLVNCLWTVA